MKKLLALMLTAALVLTLVGCGGNPKPEDGDSKSSGDELKQISEIENWLIGDIWNEGFCDLSWYYAGGTSSTGGELDVGFTLERLDKAMEKKEGYDQYMEDLAGDYEDIKDYWAKLSEQVDILYEEVKSREPVVTGKGLETDLLNQYSNAFQDELQTLKENNKDS